MQINVAVTDANNIVCEVVPPQTQTITIDRGVAGNGIVSIVPVTISTFQYLRITYTNGTVQDVGPLTSTAYTATAPITIVGNTISLATVPIASGGTNATTAADAIQNLLPSYTGNANKRLGLNSLGTALEWVLDGGGTVTSVAMTVPTGLSISGSPITTSGTLALTMASGYAIPTTASQTNWDTAYSERQQWSGTATNLVASTGRTSLGATTLGSNLFTITNPSAITFPRFNADNTVSALDAATFRTAIGAGTSSTTGTVTSVAATVPSFLSISGSPITTSGTLAFSLSGTALPTTSGGTGLTSFTSGGVVYASSTSALATGSALTFDGTKLGVGTASPTQYVHLYNSGTADLYMKAENSAGNGLFGVGSSGDTVVYSGTSGKSVIFYQNGSEQMRLTSTGLGIGTSSVTSGSKLTVAGGNLNLTQSDSRFIGGDTAGRSIFTNSDVTTYIAMYGSAHATVPNVMSFVANGNSLTFNASGNLGLGVTPSAWSGFKAFEIGSAGSSLWSSGVSDMRVSANMYYNGGYKYAGTGYATRFEQSSGGFYWYQAASGTAGNAITFTQAMTLTAAGYLGIGTTSPSADLSIGDTSTTASRQIRVHGPASGTAGGSSINLVNGTDTIFAAGNASNIIGGSYTSDAMLFWSNAALRFYGNGAERARIDSSGNLLVGTTSGSQKLVVKSTTSAAFASSITCANDGAGTAFSNTSGTATYSAAAFLTNGGGTQVGSISVTSAATLYNTTSDQRLKENIADADSASSLIDSLQVRKFDWKAGGSHQRYGFIAQELLAVAPEAVHQPEDAEEMMAVDYSKLVPMLVKEIQSLRKRLADAGL